MTSDEGQMMQRISEYTVDRWKDDGHGCRATDDARQMVQQLGNSMKRIV